MNVQFPEVWTTRDGRKIKVSDMDEHHVRAALSMMLRRDRIKYCLSIIGCSLKEAKNAIDNLKTN